MMKTLDQLEPRTPISTSGYVITNSGSYYLTRNFGNPRITGGTMITIRADEVTLDLNGFILDGRQTVLVGAGGDGIVVSGNHTNIYVFNGEFRNCSIGVAANSALNSHFERLRFEHNTTGLILGTNCVASACLAEENGVGIQVGQACVLSGCSSSVNQKGIYVIGSQNRIDSNMANNNAVSGIEVVANTYGNVVVRNQASGNNCSYSDFVIPAGNSYGHIIVGGSGEITVGSGWENFSGYPCIF